MQTYLTTQQNLSTILEQAFVQGEVRIKREDGQVFILKPEKTSRSPLDVPGLDLGISTEEIVDFIHEGRKDLSSK